MFTCDVCSRYRSVSVSAVSGWDVLVRRSPTARRYCLAGLAAGCRAIPHAAATGRTPFASLPRPSFVVASPRQGADSGCEKRAASQYRSLFRPCSNPACRRQRGQRSAQRGREKGNASLDAGPLLSRFSKQRATGRARGNHAGIGAGAPHIERFSAVVCTNGSGRRSNCASLPTLRREEICHNPRPDARRRALRGCLKRNYRRFRLRNL
jgi:hypothetical protein